MPSVRASFTEWSIYDARYSVSEVPGELLTHLHYCFLQAHPSQSDHSTLAQHCGYNLREYDSAVPVGTVECHDPHAFERNMRELALFRKTHPNVRTVAVVGGWILSWNLSSVLREESSRSVFVDSFVALVKRYAFDDIEICWEHPSAKGVPYGTHHPEDGTALALTLRELRRALPESAQTVISVSAYRPYLQGYVPALSSADVVCVMGYDFAGDWSEPGHHSPWNGSPRSVVRSIADVAAFQIPNGQICVGAPMYGRGWGAQTEAPFRVLASEKGERKYDPEAAAVMLQTEHTLWSYVDVEGMQSRCTDIVKEGLEGIRLWELSQDTRPFPTLVAVASVLSDGKT